MTQVNIVLIGPPGSGKGTQAARLCRHFSVPLISTGDMLRAAVAKGSPLGRRVRDAMAAGALIDGDVMIELVRDRLLYPDAAAGFVLDGFPRTIGQAQALDAILGERPLLLIQLVVPEAQLLRRLGRRRVCRRCQATYGASSACHAPRCVRCGDVLITRNDDAPGTIRRRLTTYAVTSEAIVGYYRERALLVSIDGSRPANQVTASILRCVDRAACAWCKKTGVRHVEVRNRA
ncbi:MAG: adenylate kinase family protein [Vicinamibacteraceae bacterium]